jgi:hypothetical protein
MSGKLRNPLAHPEDASGFDEKLMEFHKAEANRESKPE